MLRLNRIQMGIKMTATTKKHSKTRYRLVLTLASMFIMCLIMISLVSAFDFDNILITEPPSAELTIGNAYGLPSWLGGYDIAKAVITENNGKKFTGLESNFNTSCGGVCEFKFNTTIITASDVNFDYTLKDAKGNDMSKYFQKVTMEYLIGYQDIYDNNQTPNLLEHREIWDDIKNLNKVDGKTITIKITGIRNEGRVQPDVDIIPIISSVQLPYAWWTNSNITYQYRMDDNSGNSTIDAIGSFNSNITGTFSWITGANATAGNKALNCTGNNCVINTGYTFAAGPSGNLHSVTMWINGNASPSSATGGWDGAFHPVLWTQGVSQQSGGGTGYFLQEWATGNVNLIGYGSNTWFGCNFTSVRDGTWHMVGWAFNSSSVLCYKDGLNIQNVSQGLLTAAAPSGSSRIFGTFKGDYANVTALDQVTLWKVTLNRTDMLEIYNGSQAPPTTPISIDSITLIAPNNATISSSTQFFFSSNASGTNGNFTNATLYVWNGGTFTNFTTRTGTFNITNLSKNGLTDGNYNWSYQYCFKNATASICQFANQNWTIRVDTTLPTFSIISPITNTSTTSLPINVSLNITTSDANLGACWYYTNEDPVNKTYTCNTQTNVPFNNSGYYTITNYANDSAGNLNYTTISYLVNYILPNMSITPSIIEGENNTIYFNVSANNIYQANATLNYNGTLYTMTASISNSTYKSFSKIVTAPLIASDTNINANVTYYINGINYGITNQSQLIYNIPNLSISAGQCAGTPIYWFTLANEHNLSVMSGNFNYNFYYGASNTSQVRSYGSITGANNFSICINSTISSNFTIGSGEIQYSSTGYADRRYYIFSNSSVSNSSLSNITLYSLLTAQATSFLFTAQDPQLNNYKGVYLTLSRWYPDQNTYPVVEMARTDDYGQSIMRTKVEDVDYEVGVYYANGTLIYIASPQRFACLASPCSYSLLVPSTSSLLLNEYLNLNYNLSYDTTTKVFTLVFSDPSGRTSNIQLDVYKDSGDVSTLACSTNVSAASGTLTCNMSIWTGTLRAIAYRTASPQTPIDIKIIETSIAAFSGTGGLFISLIIGLVLVFIGLASPILMIIMSILALIPMIIFGILNKWVFMIVVVMGFLVVHMMRRNNGQA